MFHSFSAQLSHRCPFKFAFTKEAREGTWDERSLFLNTLPSLIQPTIGDFHVGQRRIAARRSTPISDLHVRRPPRFLDVRVPALDGMIGCKHKPKLENQVDKYLRVLDRSLGFLMVL